MLKLGAVEVNAGVFGQVHNTAPSMHKSQKDFFKWPRVICCCVKMAYSISVILVVAMQLYAGRSVKGPEVKICRNLNCGLT